jgi:hypothetical protein
VSIIALVVALGGTSYAAFSLPANSVGTKQLKNGAVSTNKIKNHAVTGAKVNVSHFPTVPSANHANTANFATNAGHAGTANSATSATTAGAANALNGVRYVFSGNLTNSAGSQDFGEAVCPAGLFVTGGGVFGSGATAESVNSSWPIRTTGSSPAPPNAWGAWMNNTDVTDATFDVYAICAPLTNASSTFAGRAQHK